MKNIIRSILYELIRTKLIYILFAICALMMVLVTVFNGEDTCISGLYLTDSSVTFTFPIFMVGTAVGMISCADMKDKVGNYEILNGHSRLQYYLARFICSVTVASLLGYILSFIPMVLGMLIFGWGTKLDFECVFVRHLLYIFPFVRLASFLACISFLVKNSSAMIAIGSAVGLSTPMLFAFFPDASDSVILSIYNLKHLMSFDTWEIYNLSSNGIDRYRSAISTLPANLIASTMVVSLVMIGAYLLIGYALFRRSDLS